MTNKKYPKGAKRRTGDKEFRRDSGMPCSMPVIFLALNNEKKSHYYT